MISFDDIKVQKGLYAVEGDPLKGTWRIAATFGIRSEKSVSKESFEANPKVLELVSESVKNNTWKHLYGDLFDPVKELQHYAIRNALPGDEETVSKLCETINKLLRLP